MAAREIRLAVLDPGAGKIFSCDRNGENIEILRENVPNFPDGVLIEPKTGDFFVTLMGEVADGAATAYGYDGSIWRMRADGSNPRKLIGDGAIRTPKQIAADYANGKLYWCDREGMRVMRANFDGSAVETLVETGRRPEDEKDQTRWCVGVAVDPKTRQVCWTQKGHPDSGEGSIRRAGYDLPAGETAANRSDIEVLFENLPEPIDLDLDCESGFLWWTDRGDLEGGNSVCRAKLSPEGKIAREHEVVLRGVGETIGMAVYREEDLLFASSLTGELYRSRLDGSEKTQIGAFNELTGLAKL